MKTYELCDFHDDFMIIKELAVVFRSVRAGRRPKIFNRQMTRWPDDPISRLSYQLVIDPSGRCNRGMGRFGSVISATSCSGFVSSVTPRPGRRFGHSLPLRKS